MLHWLLISTQVESRITANYEIMSLLEPSLLNDSEINISENKDEKILCNHCLRTSSNGVRCMGICVADNDY